MNIQFAITTLVACKQVAVHLVPKAPHLKVESERGHKHVYMLKSDFPLNRFELNFITTASLITKSIQINAFFQVKSFSSATHLFQEVLKLPKT